MTNEMTKQIRRKIKIFFILFFVLLFILGLASNLYKALADPVEDYRQIWCHDWAGLAGGVLFGSGFLVAGLSFIVFPRKTMRVLGKGEDNSDNHSIRGFIAGGLIIGTPITWFGIDILSSMLGPWITYCS
ncbi:MAG: hypothetical protein GY755_15660 [Chloroflexi bacterium]|nr:hypothetical protein [Chloroflexota bacterium]